MTQTEIMRRVRNNISEVKTISINVDPQMFLEVEEYRTEHRIETFEEAMFSIFELGRQAYRDQLDDRGE